MPAQTLQPPRLVDLGRLDYESAYARQLATLEALDAARTPAPPAHPGQTGTLLLVEHDPVITVTNRPGAAANVLAGDARLAAAGVRRVATDRGGDVTYHGPGQLVVYPILDLNALNLRLHEYLRLLEAAVIAACARWGVHAHRDVCATGVWVGGDATPTDLPASPAPTTAPAPAPTPAPACADQPRSGAKLCAMGVRVRRWISMHGLALNVTTDLSHFDLIIPCGLRGRPVTSLHALLGPACPSMAQAKETLTDELRRAIMIQAERAQIDRAQADRTQTDRAQAQPGPADADQPAASA